MCRRDALRVKDLVRIYLSACPQDPPPTGTGAPAIHLPRVENAYDMGPRRKRKAIVLAQVEDECDQPRRKRKGTDPAHARESGEPRRRKITVIDLTLTEDTHHGREVIDLTGED
ncbi:hypothetical protein LXA43DRAFT_1102731 [Ganoderma leucocontextum]|nr:hypothetical protein LXA43DRAFT_1103216 [Ganoderma leucocontextum]KAI1783268.1 hypothetical protein LXA43DRAFT_1102718 [Ganoderma leucocontextum]KAI1783280.1 hypothetical protein LXA43DRAFT_1102731 [Ganoderma leucocontextum]